LTHLALSGTGNIITKNRFENLNEVFVAMSGAGNIQFLGDAKKLNTALSGTGNITLDVNSTEMHTAMSGTGNITLSGTVMSSEIVCSGSGNVSSGNLQSKKSKVVVDGSSMVTINSSELIDVTAAGSAEVRYLGNPKVIKDLQSESRLVKIE